MTFMRKYGKLLLRSSGIVLLTGGSWICYQIYVTKQSLSDAIRADLLSKLQNKGEEYIYINQPKISVALDGSRKSQYSLFKLRDAWGDTLAWRLLEMAQKGDRGDRIKAVRSLASLHNLSDADYKQLAQACDVHTAIGLARIENVDLRYFLTPPYPFVKRTQKELINSLHQLLVSLNGKSTHSCLQYFLSKAFPEFQDKHSSVDHDVTTIGGNNAFMKDEELLIMSLQHLLHHSGIGNNAKDIVTFGGLRLLIDLQKHFADHKEMSVLFSKILSNISIHHEVLSEVFQSGWIRILASWAQNKDIYLSLPASRALANLDRDDNSGVYVRRVYLLYPRQRSIQRNKIDIVFVHGLLGGVLFTWRQRDCYNNPEMTANELLEKPAYKYRFTDEATQEYLQNVTDIKQEEWNEIGNDFEFVLADSPLSSNECASGPFTFDGADICVRQNAEKQSLTTNCWPCDWLHEDISHLRVIGINYDTHISEWSPMCVQDCIKCPLAERGQDLLMRLQKAGIGTRPVIWVGHSMGGLLIKNMLVEAWESNNDQMRDICRNTRAVVFYSVPHRGSPVAALKYHIQVLLWPSLAVKELREDSPALLDLHSRFLKMLNSLPIKIISFSETEPTLVPALKMRFIFVPKASADPGVGEFYEMSLNHMNICKPSTKLSFVYQKLVDVIQSV